MAYDRFKSVPTRLDSPIEDGENLPAGADTNLAAISRAIYVGGGGDLTVKMASGNNLVFKAVPAGTILPIRCQTVYLTVSTATNVVALN